MKKKGFTLIELLAVIIILAVIALIATPIVLNVVDNARESARKSSVGGYADATRMAIYDYQFANNGSYPNVDKIWAESNAKTKGDTINCEEVHFSETFEVVLHKCNVGSNEKKYCHANGKTYEDCENEEYKNIYANLPAQPKDLTEELKKQYNESNTVGLLKDSDSNSYYYKGTKEEVANNFVWFGGHLWRVLTINEDNSLTMITQQPITAISMTSEVWKTQEAYEASYINTWLNEVFLESIQESDRNKLVENTFNVGLWFNVIEIQSIQKVGLLDHDQFIKTGGPSSFLQSKINSFWLGNRYDSAYMHFADEHDASYIFPKTSLSIRPVIKISNLNIIEGEGNLNNPYRQKSDTTSTTNIKVGEYISLPTTGNDCGEDNRCLFRVVSKDNNSIKVILNGLLSNKSQFNPFTYFEAGYGINNLLVEFSTTLPIHYRYTGSKVFNIGNYGLDYHTVIEKQYEGNVGMPIVGEIFSGNDIATTSAFWLMNTQAGAYAGAWYVQQGGSLDAMSGNNWNLGVRPVLFLNNNLSFIGGEGTAENPFTLE